jgi:hypothetical protein
MAARQLHSAAEFERATRVPGRRERSTLTDEKSI